MCKQTPEEGKQKQKRQASKPGEMRNSCVAGFPIGKFVDLSDLEAEEWGWSSPASKTPTAHHIVLHKSIPESHSVVFFSIEKLAEHTSALPDWRLISME